MPDPSSRRRRAGSLAVLVGAAAAASAVHAATLIYRTSVFFAQIFDEALDPQLVDLGEGHGTAFEVKTLAASRLAIFLNAQCLISAATNNTYLELDILVDGVPAPPTQGAGNAFCTSMAHAPAQLMASDASVVVAPGVHTIELRGELKEEAAGNTWLLAGLSLIVLAKEL